MQISLCILIHLLKTCFYGMLFWPERTYIAMSNYVSNLNCQHNIKYKEMNMMKLCFIGYTDFRWQTVGNKEF